MSFNYSDLEEVYLEEISRKGNSEGNSFLCTQLEYKGVLPLTSEHINS